MALLPNLPIHSEVFQATMQLGPDLYYPLWEPEGSVSFADVSGNNGPPLVFYSSKFGQGTLPAAGAQLSLIGDPAGTGVEFTPEGNGSSSTQAATVIGCGPIVSPTIPGVSVPAVIGTQWAVSVSVWYSISDLDVGFTAALVNLITVIGTNSYFIPALLRIGGTAGTPGAAAALNVQNGTLGAQADSADLLLDDSLPHNVCGVVTQTSGANTVLTLYVDGVSAGTTTVTTASLGGMLLSPATGLIVGAEVGPPIFASIPPGVVSEVAVWNRALTATEVAALWTAGGLGNEGELSGARLSRFFDAYYVGDTNFSTGRSVLSASSASETSSLLDQVTRITQTELGVFWPAPNGNPTFEGRDDRFLRLTSTYTFGEDSAGGEYPYQDDIEFDTDPTFIFNDVRVNRTGGLSRRVFDDASILRYVQRGTTLDMDLLYDTVADDAANWILYTNKDGHRRIAVITFNPAANPTLWPMVLSVEIGNRVTAKRRQPAANAGAGITISYAFFVDRVSHSFDNEAAEWTTELLLSPAGASGGYPQPWILDDATYSVLGTTTILGV
jgi:hypothetical protein